MIDTDILSAVLFILSFAFIFLYMNREDKEIKGWKQWIGLTLLSIGLSSLIMSLLFSEVLYTESSAFILGKIASIIFTLGLGSYLLFKKYKKKK
tara:strand:- start:730 stop:1011 length:282 start_codon:yes stop_codon:yes gene_type:complete